MVKLLRTSAATAKSEHFIDPLHLDFNDFNDFNCYNIGYTTIFSRQQRLLDHDFEDSELSSNSKASLGSSKRHVEARRSAWLAPFQKQHRT